MQDTSVEAEGELNSGIKIFPLSKNWTTSSLHVGHFTAACGVFVYRGDLLPEAYRGAVFTCDPTGNLVHQEILEDDGATFRSRPARAGVEFLASPDDRFRPVSLATGPDGALYVVDMARAVIEHPEFMPVELKNAPTCSSARTRDGSGGSCPPAAEAKPKPARPHLAGASTRGARPAARSSQRLVADDGPAAAARAQRPEGAGAAAGDGRLGAASPWRGSRPRGCSSRSACSMTTRSSCCRSPTRPASARTR